MGSLDESMGERRQILLFAQLPMPVQTQLRLLLSQSEVLAKMPRDTKGFILGLIFKDSSFSDLKMSFHG